MIYGVGIYYTLAMNNDGWQVSGVRHNKRKAKRAERKVLLEQCPHMILSSQAKFLQYNLNIDNLAATLLADESKELQQDGWVYTRVIRPDEEYDDTLVDFEYKTIGNFNRWGDLILFTRKSKRAQLF
jgi:hypothetical protein